MVQPTTLRISWVSSHLWAAFSWRHRSTVSRRSRIGSGSLEGVACSWSSMVSSRREIAVLEQGAVDVHAAVEHGRGRAAHLPQPLLHLLQQHRGQGVPVHVVLQRALAAVNDLVPGGDEVGVVDIDLDLRVMPGPEAPQLQLHLLRGRIDAAREGVDLADLARLAGGGRGHEIDGVDLAAAPAAGDAAREWERQDGDEDAERPRHGSRGEGGDETARKLARGAR